MWPNPHADLVTFTEEILNVKLHFLCFVFAFEQNTYIVGYVGLQQEKLSPPPHYLKLMVGVLDYLSRDFRAQNQVVPRSTQSFILPWPIKWKPGIPGNFLIKSKLSPSSCFRLQWQCSLKSKICFFELYRWSYCEWHSYLGYFWRNWNSYLTLPEVILKFSILWVKHSVNWRPRMVRHTLKILQHLISKDF